MIKWLVRLFYDLTYPKAEHKAVYPYRLEFLLEMTTHNLEHLWYLLIASQVVYTILLFILNLTQTMRFAINVFLILNLFQLIFVYRIKKRNYGLRYRTLLNTQNFILLNTLFITSAFNVFQNSPMILVHITIIAYVFMAIVLHIPSADLLLLAFVNMVCNIIGVIIYHDQPQIVQFEIINIVVFTLLSWWLGVIANRNRILIWMNLKRERELNQNLEIMNKKDAMTNFYNHDYI